MKITIYELLGLVKDGKAPKKIIYRDNIWEYVSTIMGTGYQYYSTFFEEWKTLQNQVYLEEHLNDEVEIIEEDKKIEKLNLPSFEEFETMNVAEQYVATAKEYDVLNELIDEVNKLKGDDNNGNNYK